MGTDMATDYMDLLELQQRIKEGIEDAFPGRIWVKAEISQWSPRANGHCYLSLSESRDGRVVAEVRAMIWKWNYLQLKTFFEEAAGQPLQAGITVLVRVEVSYSELYGISLFIDDIDPAFTLGEAALERKRTIERLTAGGYMDMQKELALPPLPRRLAVITSRTAAGYGDFRRHLLENEAGYAFELDLYEALMQGESAPASIVSALQQARERGGYDAVLILRGGGSELDLACFDDYDLAVSIATCPLPVVTAIGHDRDVHVADMVASRSVKTPTALADLFLDAFMEEDMRLDTLESRITMAVMRRYQTLEGILDRALYRLRFAVESRLGKEEALLKVKEALIGASDPRKILSLGYVLVTGSDNKVLKSARGARVGERIGVRFSDGAVRARVEEVSEGQEISRLRSK